MSFLSEEEEESFEVEDYTEFVSSVPEDIIELRHSFGYDCKRLYNLCLIDDDTLVFASGNYLHYFKISTGEITFRESFYGAGIGFVTKNVTPEFEGLLTVGENGKRPSVIIYEFPSHNIRIKLDGAAKSSFTCGSYNSTGELLATQAGPPDFMLTIWRWEKAEVILRSKSFQNDVLFVHFSAFNPILLVSCGLSHIKFWKMANTFTGLKLQGDLGRFGKTDFSDIYAAVMLTDENVISGCDWGNMLLWEAGLIKFEVCRKGRKPCHNKPITRITFKDGEVMTIGMDGYCRIWFWETVDLADPPDEDRFVEIEPIYEFRITDCEIRHVQKIKPYDEQDFGYYAQDGYGGIWYCDFNTSDIPAKPRKLYSCHGGKVIAAQMSPISPHLITLGEDGKLFCYNYETKKTLMEKKFNAIGTDLIWFNTNISSNGMELIASYEDGVIRQMLFDLTTKEPKLHLVRAIKAHTAPLTKLAVNPKNTMLATGSSDRTIFLYTLTEKIEGLVNLQAMGFIDINGVPNFLNWKKDEPSTILIGGLTGEVYEYKLPTKVTEEQVFLSFRLTEEENLKSFKFASIKSRIRRDNKREEIKRRKALKRQRKLEDIERLKAINPGLQIDMNSALADSEDDEPEEPLHIPAKPNPILWLKYTDEGSIWLSMGGYDAGYIYEVEFGHVEPVRSTLIVDGDDCEIHSFLNMDTYLLFGMVTGKIRINHPYEYDFRDLRDYRLFSMHDSLRGNIPKIIKSYDGYQIASVGHDGNVFVYDWNGPKVYTAKGDIQRVSPPQLTGLEDIEDPEYPSLEQEKIFAEQKRQAEAAAEHDRKILLRIGELQVQFNEIMRDNQTLPEQLQLPHREMLLDNRITNQIQHELQAELDDVRDDLAYDLEFAQVGKKKLYSHFIQNLDHIPIHILGIRADVDCYSFRLEKLGNDFEELKDEIDERLRKEREQRGPAELKLADEQEDSMPEPPIELFFFGRDPETIIPRFSKKMLRLLKRYRSRQLHEIERVYEWEKLYRRKPDPNKNHVDDDRKIREAERTLGDYKLKVGHDYEPQQHENLTHKAIEIVECREKLFDIQNDFNAQLFNIRQQKKDLYDYIAIQRKRLNRLHNLMPAKNRVFMKVIPENNIEQEYPELNLIEHYKPTCGVEIKDLIDVEKSVNDYLPKPQKAAAEAKLTLMEIHEIDKYNSMRADEVEFIPDHDKLMALLDELPTHNDPAHYESETDSDYISPWLKERRYQWILNMMEEQDNIIASVEECILKFDNALQKINYVRLHVKFDVEFLQSNLITLNQEIYILRDSEEIENQLLANAEEAMRARNDMQTLINTAKRQIDESRKACDRLNEQIGIIQVKFMSTVKGHKFFDFLRRIFKKKFKLPKPPKVGDESSESSSDDDSSSEDENADTKSVDSADMTTIRLDEGTCPSGLERTMYDLAFKLRSDRHALEHAVIEQHKLIDIKRKDVNELQKKMRYHEEVYDREKNTLLDFRRKRQQEMNKVKTSVVLNMNQIQHFEQGEDFRDLKNAILFDAARLSKLKLRAEELNQETLQTKRLHCVNIVHLVRMNRDMAFMRYEIIRLEDEIKQSMLKKFGIILNLDDLEAEVLRRHVFELETTAEMEMQELEKEMRKRRNELVQLEEQYIDEIRINSEKLNILSVLQEDKNILDTLLDLQDKNFEKFLKQSPLKLDRDIEKLTVISKRQKEQIQCLERELCTLRMKSKPLQMDHKGAKEVEVTTEVLPNDDACHEVLATEIYPTRMVPDDFTMDRVNKITMKYFVRNFKGHMSTELIRKYCFKTSRYLGHAAFNFEGILTDRILDCLTEQLQNLLPKKYLLYMSSDELQSLFTEILELFDYDHSEANTEDLISGIFSSAMEAVKNSTDVLNKSQLMLEEIFKQLVEVFPLEEFISDDTLKFIIPLLTHEKIFEPRCVSIENLVDEIVRYSKENLLDSVTALAIRRLAQNIQREVPLNREALPPPRCSIGSVSTISISTKK